jgi:acetyl esterase/lipase
MTHKTSSWSQLIAAIIFCVASPIQSMSESTPPVPPTIVDFAYGHDSEREKFDIWKATSDKPTPIVIMIHGGGWIRGEKGAYKYNDAKPYLDRGISVARLNYRLIGQAMEQGVEPPVKACLLDAARALQTIRAKAAEWNIDPTRIGATGGSAGACTSLWLALHDDLANPKSDDLIARQSTRLTCAAVDVAQTSLDPKQLREWMANAEYAGHAFGFMAEGRSRKEEFELLLANREKYLPLIKEYSPIEWVSSDDPPVYLDYLRVAAPEKRGAPQENPTHSAINGIMLAERMKDIGVEAIVSYKGHEDTKYGSIQNFLIKKLLDK